MLDATTIDAFRRDGAVKLTGVFGPEWIAALRDGVARNMAEPGSYAKGYTAEGKPGLFFGDYCNWRRIPEYEDFLKNSPAPDLAGALMGSETVVLFHEHVLVKEPATAERTPWHHDQPYYCVEGTQTCSLWIPLDAVPRQTCVEFVAGSHAWGKRFMPTKFKGEAYDRADDNLEPLPDIEAARDDYSILGWDMEPGDAIAFSFLTVHGAPGNLQSAARRRAFAARYCGGDVVYVRRQGEVSPPFPDVRLSHGDPLRGEEFPVVRG
ncbi:MAG: phytanoyl-CoA dioxygenase family protein [Alphaproteobacteria bacterium]|nr:phytanoyl-CoA dioxygenase family protein [Alphaproteobacteria bacterium]